MAEKEKPDKLEKLKAEYEKLRQKYKLPSFDELNNEFEIYDIKPNSFIIREIRRRIIRKMEDFLSLLNPILNPNPNSLHSMIETKIFEKQDMEPMFEFYKKLFQLAHKSIPASLESESAEAAWINEVWKAWPDLKKQITGYSKKITEGWGKVEPEVFTDKYLG
jgi:RNA processing factor Prp31